MNSVEYYLVVHYEIKRTLLDAITTQIPMRLIFNYYDKIDLLYLSQIATKQ